MASVGEDLVCLCHCPVQWMVVLDRCIEGDIEAMIVNIPAVWMIRFGKASPIPA
jgi:hypothetical protein